MILVRKLVDYLAKGNKKEHEHITYFNPDVISLEKSHQDFLSELELFNAGKEYKNFNDFICKEAIEYKNNGDGVTYVVWNVMYDKNNNEIKRDVVSYYTLAATSIPYEDRIRLDEEDAKIIGQEFDTEICGISAIEIKMFAVNEKYQNKFFVYEGEDLPISAWVMRSIIDFAYSIMNEVIGFKALFLHSLPEAENFYKMNGFNAMEINMQPLHCLDSDYTAMYLSLRNVHMNYDK